MEEFSQEETFGSDFVEVLIKEYEKEVAAEAVWPTLVIHSDIRKQVWSICESVGQSDRGVPATACRLVERFLSSTSKIYLKDQRDAEAWARQKVTLGKQLYLIIVSCVQLAAKMNDRVAHVPASLMKSILSKAGIQHTKAEIISMEIHVLKTLDFRLPTWSTLETAEFLATMMGLKKDLKVRLTLAPILDMAEYNRDIFENHIKAWEEKCNTPGSSSSRPSSSGTVHNLHLCAGVVAATVRHTPSKHPDPTDRLAALLKADASYIKAIADIIIKRILPDKKTKPTLKRKRQR